MGAAKRVGMAICGEPREFSILTGAAVIFAAPATASGSEGAERRIIA
jgi:hypothetical protein